MELEAREHGTAQIFHVGWKAGALGAYLIGSWFSLGFSTLFVVVVLLLAFDFWTTKNVSGRLLVGLRWWSEVREDGSTVWIFESRPTNRQVHPTDARVFWTALYGAPLAWMLLGLGAVFTLQFQWLLVVVVALVLSGANCVGYWRCERDAKQKLQTFIAQRL